MGKTMTTTITHKSSHMLGCADITGVFKITDRSGLYYSDNADSRLFIIYLFDSVSLFRVLITAGSDTPTFHSATYKAGVFSHNVAGLKMQYERLHPTMHTQFSCL